MKLALVSGSNRGLGKEVCKQLLHENYRVIMAARDLNKASHAYEKIIKSENSADFSDKLIPIELDIS